MFKLKIYETKLTKVQFFLDKVANKNKTPFILDLNPEDFHTFLKYKVS